MKKHIYLAALGLAAAFTTNAQTKIKDGSVTSGSLPHTRAILDLESNNKGLLLPRLTETERNAMSTVPEGMVIFNTTDSCINQYNRGQWNSLCETGNFCKVVMVTDTLDRDVTDPNTIGINEVFEPADEENACALYITDDGGTWIWNGSTYITKSLAVEPWWNKANNTPSNSLTHHIYHLGSVNVGTGYAPGQYSMTVGVRDTVNGAYSMAVGNDHKVPARQSFVSGSRNFVDGAYLMVMGVDNHKYGARAALFGSDHVDSSDYSLVGGRYNYLTRTANGNLVGGNSHYISGLRNGVVGLTDSVTGDYNLVAGQSQKMFSSYSIMAGRQNISNAANYSAVFGYQNKDSAAYTLVAGHGNIVTTTMPNATVIGKYNQPISGALLTVGNGTSDAARSNAFTVKSASLIMPKSASAPASPVEGEMYFNNTDKKTYVYDGTVWQALY